jgi:capsular polysaccharide biosynthesis protein
MSEQALDLRRSIRIVGRYKALLGMAAAAGLLVGLAFAVLRPPLFTSKALVVLSSSGGHTIGTQVFIADSDPVLTRAAGQLQPPVSLDTLRARVQAGGLSSQIITISAQGTSSAQAEQTANAVARSYVVYVSSAADPIVRVPARVLQLGTTASRSSVPLHLLASGVLGALAGLLAGAIAALVLGRGDRRLRRRDEIADAIGIPVLAALPSRQPHDAAGWARLLEGYEPGTIEAWNLRKTLHQLGLDSRDGSSVSLAVVSLSTDRRALALGPQLAAYAASLGIPTAFILGPPQGAGITAMLHTACATASAQSAEPGRLLIGVRDHEDLPSQPLGASLTVVTAVIDAADPRMADTLRTAVTLLGVSAGGATAEQLARVAVSAAADDRQITGILVADPDPADHSMGRLPDLVPTGRRRRTARLTGSTSENPW